MGQIFKKTERLCKKCQPGWSQWNDRSLNFHMYVVGSDDDSRFNVDTNLPATFIKGVHFWDMFNWGL